MIGAKANDFPIKDCGLFGDKLKSPRNLGEAISALDYLVSPEDKIHFQELSETEFVISTHRNLGRWLRNNWGLWQNSLLVQWFKPYGITHPDDISGIILTSYYRKNHHLPTNLEKQIRHYIDYWKIQETKQSEFVDK